MCIVNILQDSPQICRLSAAHWTKHSLKLLHFFKSNRAQCEISDYSTALLQDEFFCFCCNSIVVNMKSGDTVYFSCVWNNELFWTCIYLDCLVPVLRRKVLNDKVVWGQTKFCRSTEPVNFTLKDMQTFITVIYASMTATCPTYSMPSRFETIVVAVVHIGKQSFIWLSLVLIY